MFDRISQRVALAPDSRKVFPVAMSRPRLDPSAPTSIIGACITAETHNRVIELTAERGTSRSAVVRELIELGLDALDADEDGQ